VGESFKQPLLTWDITGKAVLNILEVIRQSSPTSRVCFAASSEMYGNNSGYDGFINENTPFNPQSPYAIAKCAGYYAIQLYRSYGLFCCNSIAFNHESERRGENFVTRKITKYIGDNIKEIKAKKPPKEKLKLGNLSACRDWSHAGDIVNGMVLMLRQNAPDDYILASGETHSVQEFLENAFTYAGVDYHEYVEIDPELFRPAEVHRLLGNSGKARVKLGWRPVVNFKDLIRIMIDKDTQHHFNSAINDISFKDCGCEPFSIPIHNLPQLRPTISFLPYSD
jgi:GDPmannose 4,6-dehydratase